MKTLSRQVRRLLLALPVGLMLPVTDAVARQLEEVVVTATKREAGLQDVPIAITALTGEDLERKNILSATDLEKFTPGLRLPQQDASRTFVRIRGVGSRKFDIGSEGSVGIFVDEIYIPRFSSADLGFFDAERVEVLKGPQGTILGRNTAAGAISVTNRRPTDEPEGFVDVGFGNEDSYLLRGAYSAAVSDTVAVRASLARVEQGGFQQNTLTGTTDDRTSNLGRLQLSWEATDTLSVLGTVQYSEREQKALLQKNTSTREDGVITPLFGSPGVVYVVNDDLRDYPMTEDGEFTGESVLSSLRIEKFVGDLSLISITGYQHTEDDIFEDFDAAQPNIGTSSTDTESDTWSQEFRAVGSNFLAGLFLYHDTAESDGGFFWGEDSLQAFLSGEPFSSDTGIVEVETTSWALFGEYRFDLADSLSLTVGGRYSFDQKDYEYTGETSLLGLPAIFAPFFVEGTEDWSSFDPKVALTWEPRDDFMAYLTYSEGYKSGGVQFTAINEELARQLFDPEELSAYELGLKSELLDKTLRLNASLFYYEYEDLQVQRVDGSLTGGVPVAFTDNAARSDINGFEVEAFWLLPHGFATRLAYAYLDATYDEYFGNAGEDFSGNPLPVSPENTVMISLDYQADIAGGWKLFAGTDWTWVDDHNFDVNDDPTTAQADYWLGGVTLSIMPESEQWGVTAFVDNVLDEDYYSQVTRRESELIASAADGRRFGVRFSYQF